MRVALAFVVSVNGMVLSLPDPLCKTGVADIKGEACCPKTCGSCDDESTECNPADKANAQLACCPSAIMGQGRDDTGKNRLCDVGAPPCRLGEDYQAARKDPMALYNPDDVNNVERHARDDCNVAVEAELGRHKLASYFVKREGTSYDGGEGSCGTYTNLVDAANACRADKDCFGIQKNGDELCLKIALGSAHEDETKTTYIKIKDRKGDDFGPGITAVSSVMQLQKCLKHVQQQ